MCTKKLFLSKLCICLLFGFALFVPQFALSQSENSSSQDKSIDELREMVEANPDSISYHQQFIDKFKEVNKATWHNQDSVLSLLEPQYKAWMAEFPHSAAVPFAMGHAYANAESPEAKSYLLKAVELDPSLAEAWMDLSIDAERWGDSKAAHEYMGNAAKAAPGDPGYAFYYAMDFEHIDREKWRSMLYDLAKRFPDHERGAQGLYWLAYRSKDASEKLKVFEQLRQWYPPNEFGWSKSGMGGLYELYLKQNPEKAKELAQAMGDDRNWPLLDTLAQNFVQTKALMSQHQYEKAAAILRQAKLPRYPDLSSIKALQLAMAEDGAGNTGVAYENLVTLFAKEPTDKLLVAINKYAGKLNKDKNQIKNDIWEVRKKEMKPAPPFKLGLYTSNGTASLEDFSGKVVLLTFWFPGCGPCRGEFPHFQNVIDKFDKKDVAYVGINVVPQQDEYVLPFMEGTGYTFIPLRATNDWAEKVYKVRGQPTNFLIDQQGRIVFSHFRTDGNNERTLELMINSLLERNE